MYRFFHLLSVAMALLGGAMLTGIVLMTCASIAGRELHASLGVEGVNEIKGVYELTEGGMAFVVFAFLPLTQLTAGHAIVDIFTSMMGATANRWLRGFGDVLFALALILIAAQLYQGMLSKLNSGQTTLFLQMPLWWSYGLSVIGAVIAAVVACYVALVRIAEMVAGRDMLPATQEVDH